MFAVPGWSLSPTQLKQQSDDSSAKAAGAKSRKRKRANPAQAVTDDNVAELWDQHQNNTGKGHDNDSASRPSDAAAAPASKPKDKKSKIAHGSGPIKQADIDPTAAVEAMEKATEPIMTGAKAQDGQAPGKKNKKNKSKDDQKVKNAKDIKSSNDSEATIKPAPAPPAVSTASPISAPAPAQLTPLQAAMRQKLVSARFRHLNETLYTAPSTSSLELFAANPEMFNDYHSGFRQQVSVWPENPVDVFIRTLRRRARVKPQKFNRNRRGPPKNIEDQADAPEQLTRTRGVCTIADLGCGDARLASELIKDKTASKCELKILSYDLQSNSPHVIKADAANLPLPDGSVDIAIFCLALMGTNWVDFIEEAYRVLHWKGELWIAEIKSRFGRVEKSKSAVVGHSVGSKKKQAMNKKKSEVEMARRSERADEDLLKTEVDGEEKRDNETDVSAFLAVLSRRGFELKKGRESIDLGNKMFVRLELVKCAKPTAGKHVQAEEIKPDADGEGRKKKPLKFLDAPKITPEQEASVLKPCLYKIR